MHTNDDVKASTRQWVHAALRGSLHEYVQEEMRRVAFPQPICTRRFSPEPTYTPFRLNNFLRENDPPAKAQHGVYQVPARFHVNCNNVESHDFATTLAELHALGLVGLELIGNRHGLRLGLLTTPNTMSALAAIIEARTQAQLVANARYPLDGFERHTRHLVLCEAATSAGYHEILASGESFIALIARILSSLPDEEIGMLQCLAVGTQQPWNRNISELYQASEHLAHFNQRPMSASNRRQAQIKTATPLFWTTLRLAAWCSTRQRTRALHELFKATIRTLRHGTHPLRSIPQKWFERTLQRQGIEAMLDERRAHTPGILLNAQELAGIIHLPSKQTLATNRFIHASPTSKHTGLALGQTDDGMTVHLPIQLATRGMRVLGNNGTGKTTFLLSLCLQLLAIKRYGFALLDCHGDIDLLCYIPPEDAERVVLFNPTIAGRVCSYSPLHLRDGDSASRRAESITLAFQSQSTVMREVMATRLNYALYALLKTPGSCLADIKVLFGSSPEGTTLRRRILAHVDNPACAHFIRHELPSLNAQTKRPLMTLLNKLLLNEYTAALFHQRESAINLRQIMDDGKILLISLPIGIMGDQAAGLVGSFLLSDIYSAAMSRVDTAPRLRRPFGTIVDEFHRFITTGREVENLLRQARKFGLATILASQDLEGLPARVVAALENAGSTICFDVGQSAAAKLARDLGVLPVELQRQGVGVATVRLDTTTFCIQIPLPDPPIYDGAQVLQQSIAKYYTTTSLPEPRGTDTQEQYYDEI